MRKFITYIIILAAFAAVSCSRTEQDFKQGMKSSTITLSLNTGDLVTRSAIPAVESEITQFDWFFYADKTGNSEPIHHGHFTVNGTALTPSVETPSDYETDDEGVIHLGFDVENAEAFKNLNGSCYVYVLANYEGIDHTGTLTLNTLLAKTMETQWDEQDESYSTISDFVMDSFNGNDEDDYPQLIPLSAAEAGKYFTEEDGEGIISVPLRRVAAKVSFILTISEQIEDPKNAAVTNESEKTYWRPLTTSSNYAAYMVNAVKYATVAGEPLDADDVYAMAPNVVTGVGGKQISYATSHVKTATDDHEPPLVWELDPFYTYPVEFDTDSNNAPYLKIALPWENVDSEGNLVGQGATLYYYKVYLLDPETNKPLASYDRNKHYRVNLAVNTLGGTQEDYTTLDTFYYVADWQAPAGGTYNGYFAPRYLDIARPTYYIYGDESITIAVTSSHPISAEIVGTPTQMDINARERIRSISYNAEQDSYSLSIRQTYYTDTSNPQTRTAETTTTASVSADGKSSFTLNYKMITQIDEHLMDLTPITWKVKVYHTDKEAYSKEVTIIQYPSIYLELNPSAQGAGTLGYNGETTFLDSNKYPSVNSSTTYQARVSGVYLGSLGGGTPTSRDKTVFTVSTLASLSGGSFGNMVIGDPRVPISTLWGKDALTHQGRTWSRTDLGGPDDGQQYGDTDEYIDNYLVAAPNKTNFIAPRFMFASGKLGTNNVNSNPDQGGNWRTAAERCAAYQEDGYPAGRWRLPTEAEISFCRQIQANGYITSLFYPSNRYWTASGSYYQGGNVIDPATENDVRPSPNNTSNNGTGIYRTASVRCVYDLWYWGEENYDNDGNKITVDDSGTPSGTPATVWLGYKTEN